MNVLVLESEAGAATAAVEELEAAGHSVLRCHEPGSPAFPCAALQDGCPLETGGVDVALTVRAHPRSQPALLEDGVVCALKARLPVVVGGRALFNPYVEFGAETADPDDLVGSCERAAASARPEHSRIATDSVHETLTTTGIDAPDAFATVRRHGGRLVVQAAVPADTPQRTRDMVAVRIAGALRAYDPGARGLDIEVESVATLPG
jgi:hypothetical protein